MLGCSCDNVVAAIGCHPDAVSITMLSCKEVARLISESLDRKLAWHERVQLRIHLLLCSSCSSFRKQMQFLRRAARSCAVAGKDVAPASSPGLSTNGKERLKQALE